MTVIVAPAAPIERYTPVKDRVGEQLVGYTYQLGTEQVAIVRVRRDLVWLELLSSAGRRFELNWTELSDMPRIACFPVRAVLQVVEDRGGEWPIENEWWIGDVAEVWAGFGELERAAA